MLITNGTKTRNIQPSKLPEYEAKGYKEVKTPPKADKPAKGKK